MSDTRTFSFSAQDVYLLAARYLLNAGWYQDGDDPGIWRHDDLGTGMSFERALDTQLAADRVDQSFLVSR